MRPAEALNVVAWQFAYQVRPIVVERHSAHIMGKLGQDMYAPEAYTIVLFDNLTVCVHWYQFIDTDPTLYVSSPVSITFNEKGDDLRT